MVDISHPLARQASDLVVEIEKFPASDQQTRCVTMASELCAAIAKASRGGPSLESSQETTEKAEAAVADYIAQLCHSDSERKGWARRIVKLVVGGLRAVPSQESGPTHEIICRTCGTTVDLCVLRHSLEVRVRGASPSGRGDPQKEG